MLKGCCKIMIVDDFIVVISGGYCTLYPDRLLNEAEHMSALQSWGPELVNFVKTDNRPNDFCDLVIEKPTYIMKLDASKNIFVPICCQKIMLLHLE